MNVLVGTSAYNSHVQNMVRALYEADALYAFVTGGVDNFRSPLARAARSVVARALPGLSRQLSRRSVAELPSDRVRARWSWEAPRVAASQMHAARVEDWIWERGERAIDRHCARLLRNPVIDAYLGVEYGALASLQSAASLGKAGFVAFLSPHHKTRAAWVDAEYAKHPELSTGAHAAIDQLTPTRDARRDEEAAVAKWIVSGSSFTTRSLIAAGFAESKILTIPLGGPDAIDANRLPRTARESTRFVYVGPVSIRKGAHYLLRAWSRLATRQAELHFYGKVLLPEHVVTAAKAARGGDRIVFHGSVAPSDLEAAYGSASILVLPTLCDGFGVVVSEALANGLPVLTTRNAGAADAITNGRSGLIIPAADEDALVEALDWCLNHPADLLAMRQEALKAAARWTWAEFRVRFRELVAATLNPSLALAHA